MRLDDFEADRIRGELVREGRRAYEGELTDQAKRVGCRSRRGQLTAGPALTELNDLYAEHATGIVATYNYDLAGAILSIAAEVPTANRHVYARRLQGWDVRRKAWKDPQVQQVTEGYARAKAQRDFYRYNDIQGSAVLRPEAAACPVCAAWVARGEVPVEVATNNPPPYHPNCFPPDAMVMLADGTEKRIDQVKEGELVASRKGNCLVSQVFRRRTEEALYRVSVAGRVLELTGDHPVLTARGWLVARDLRVGDQVVRVRFHESRPDDS
jgi:hypothetical protein